MFIVSLKKWEKSVYKIKRVCMLYDYWWEKKVVKNAMYVCRVYCETTLWIKITQNEVYMLFFFYSELEK